jgi:hypothetical protein
MAPNLFAMKKFVFALFAAAIACFAALGPAQAHCAAYDPLFGTCISYVPDPPSGWRYCVSPGSPNDNAVQLFTGANYSGTCIERTTIATASWVPNLGIYDWNDWMGSVKNRRHGLNSSLVLYGDYNYGGCSWIVPYGDTANIVSTCGGGSNYGWVSSLKADGHF